MRLENGVRDADGAVHRDHPFPALAPRSATGALPEAIGGPGPMEMLSECRQNVREFGEPMLTISFTAFCAGFWTPAITRV
jgi:hypothetical protein